jgi:hypothetical protein
MAFRFSHTAWRLLVASVIAVVCSAVSLTVATLPFV